MQRRSFLKNTVFTLSALALLDKKSLAAFLNDPAYKVTMLTDTIGIFTERGGTILFSLGKESIVVVDAQFPDTATHCIEEIKKRSKKSFGLLINTHHHGDHTAGNIAFKGLAANVLAHENSRINQQAAAAKNNNVDKQLFPDRTYKDIRSEAHGSETIDLRYFGRGHTNGDSFVHFKKANIVHLGDLVFNRRHPFVDRSAGASIREWITTLETAVAAFDETTTYICGHAAVGYDVVIKKADVLAFRDYLQNVVKFTKENIDAGISKDDFLKSTEIPGSPEWQGDGIKRPLEAAWDELSEKAP